MTIRALAVPEPVPHRSGAASQTRLAMTCPARELSVRTFERIRRELFVIEGADLEGVRDVARVTGSLGRGKSKLPGVHIPVAAPALTGRAAVGCPFSALAVLFGRTMAAIAGGLGVHTGQGPGAVVDLWRIPTSLGVAVSTAAVAHLGCELLPVRVVVTVDATLCLDLQVVVGPFALVTTRAADGLMLAVERKFRAAVLLDREQRGPEAVLIVATRAVGRPEAAPMGVAMAVRAFLELQAPVSTLHWELGRMATLASYPAVQSLQGKRRLRVRA